MHRPLPRGGRPLRKGRRTTPEHLPSQTRRGTAYAGKILLVAPHARLLPHGASPVHAGAPQLRQLPGAARPDAQPPYADERSPTVEPSSRRRPRRGGAARPAIRLRKHGRRCTARLRRGRSLDALAVGKPPCRRTALRRGRTHVPACIGQTRRVRRGRPAPLPSRNGTVPTIARTTLRGKQADRDYARYCTGWRPGM